MRTSATVYYYGRAITLGRVRRVWAALSANPQQSVRAIGGQLGMSFGEVARALQVLRDAGYITFPHQACRARRILVPFAFIPAEDPPDDAPGQGGDIDGIPQGGTDGRT